MRFGAMDATKPYEFIGFGAMDATKPYEFIGFGGFYVVVSGPSGRPKPILSAGSCTRAPGRCPM